MKKTMSLLLLIVMILSLTACKQEEKPTTDAANSTPSEVTKETSSDTTKSTDLKDNYYPITITTYDFEGNPIEETFEKMPEKVVAIYQSALENMLALGLGDKIIYTAYLDVPVKDEWKEQFDNIQYGEKAPDKEAVIAMEPDMIVSWKSYFGEKMLGDVPFWHERNIKTYINLNSGLMKPNKLEYEFEDLLNMGKIFNKQVEAQALVDAMKADIAAAQKHVEGKEKVSTVILEVGKENTFRNYGGDSIGGNIAELVGADLLIPESGNFGAEELIEKNPQVIFTVYYGDSILSDEAVKKITENPTLQSLDAVKNNRVYAIMLSEVYASGARTADGIRSIIKGLYPDLN